MFLLYLYRICRQYAESYRTSIEQALFVEPDDE